MEKIFLKTINNGSYGYILEDNNNNIYKLSLLGDKYNIYKNNIIECCILNKNLYKNKLKNIPITNINLYIMYQFKLLFEVDFKCIKMFNNYECDDNTYLFIIKMEKYDITLNKFINNNSIFENKLIFPKIAKQMLQGLYILHQNNFIHGDLKPLNIMINKDLNIHIIDFGGIKTTDMFFYSKTCTLTYRSLEELNFEINKKKYFKPDFKNDIWSLGIIFSEILLKQNFIQNYYSKLIKKYKKMYNCEKINEEKLDKYLEQKIYDKFSNKIINIQYYASKYNIFNVDDKYISIINKMLSINVNNRYNNINEIYLDLFNKNIDEDIIDNYKINYDYNINIDNDKINKLLDIRKEYYIWLLNYYTNDEILIFLPLTFNIADRFFSYILNDGSITNLITNLYIYKIIMISCLILSMTFLYIDIPELQHIYNFFCIKDLDFKNFNMLTQYIINLILTNLNFDIYRPYNDIKLTEDLINNNNLFLQYKQNLYKKINLLFLNEKINLTSDDYFTNE